MSDHAPGPAERVRFRDSTFLLTIAVLALVGCALSFYMQKAEHPAAVNATANDEARTMPLPSGPRKYP
ncbi:MAG: hypothetical protein QOF91_386 [Alphaproteobacteria bacterium]|jgi:hypothetical protein|nr:hypothetical protein [Alphaproteobacteria bacterium]MEA3025101.1 hypothetical protein [Alphaproteobacteria bacterium]